MKNNKALTLMELLIIIPLLIILATGVLVLIRPMSLIQNGNDTARKKDLDDAKKMLEEYYNDTGCYPQPTQVCTEGYNGSPCHICTKNQSPKFSYFTRDICDPKEGSLPYLYQTEKNFVYKVGNVVVACPRWFKIFSVLDSAYNAADDIWGCKEGGCGDVEAGVLGYRYLVTSPGSFDDKIATDNWYCFTDDCVQCTPYENCTLDTNACYQKQLYPTRLACCTDHDPNSPNCL